MSDRSSPNTPSGPSGNRRSSSFSGQPFADLLNRSAHLSGTTPGPITAAAAQVQRRRLSLTTVGLTGSASQTSPFSAMRTRGESMSSATSASVDESPFEDSDGPPVSSNPNTPFGRRLSFGVNALRDARMGGNAGNANSNEGFNFAENMRSRASRTSISSSPPTAPVSPIQTHHRVKSVAAMEPPVKEMPKAKEPKVPDYFQERILKGDFYMD